MKTRRTILLAAELLAACLFALLMAAAAKADVAVRTWPIGSAAVSITHDDNRPDHFNIAAPELAARGLLGTFNVNPGKWVAQGYDDDFAAVAAMGHELASHTMQHQGWRVVPGNPSYFETIEDVEADAVAVLAALDPLQYGGRPTVSITYPFGQSEQATRDLAAEYFISGRNSDNAGVNAATPDNLFGLHTRIIGSGASDPTAWSDYAYTMAALTACVDEAAAVGGWSIEEYHDVDLPGYGGVNLDAYLAHLDDLAAAVAAELLWVAPQGDVARYIRQRDAAAVYEVAEAFGTVVSIDDGLDDVVFDLPLAIDVAAAGLTWSLELLADGVPLTISYVPGDANLDGVVDGSDYVAWTRNYGNPARHGAADGDFNYDGLTDAADYLIWADGYGQSAATAVPEPGGALFLLVGSLGLLLRRKGGA